MRTNRHSPNSIFLMELLFNILLFSILLMIGLQFFIKSHTLIQKTTELHYAVTLCSNVASIFENQKNTGSISDISVQFPYCTNMKDQTFIYFDRNFEECRKKHAAYYILVSPASETEYTNLSSANISFFSSDKTPVYSLTAYNYQSLTPSIKE